MKAHRKHPHGAFRDFILAQPHDMLSPEVVSLGKKAGLRFSQATVKSTRHRFRAKVAISEPEVPEEPKPVPLTAAAFVRSLPTDTPTEEVIARAAEAGLRISAASVHNAHSVVRRKAAAAAAAAAGQPRAGAFPTGAAFVRTLPLDMPVEEVIAKGAEAGIALTRNMVYSAQVKARAKAQGGLPQPSGAPRAAARTARASRDPKGTEDPQRAAKRQQFKQLILELGMDDAESIWEDFAAIRNGIRR